MLLGKKFYQQETLKVARNLLGCFLVREIAGQKLRGMITEVEAYVGEDDLASHAAKGRTKRSEVMYGAGGHAYVYMIYGMYHCLNVVTEKKDFPAAVLIRGVRVEGVESKKTNGPGKVCRFFQIDRKFNGWDLVVGKELWLEGRESKVELGTIKKSKRIGIDYAKHCKDYLWRFYLEG